MRSKIVISHRRIGRMPLVNWVVVLGDFGRSPRMQYHTQSMASKPNSIVHVIAYGGAAPLDSLVSASNVHIHSLPEVPRMIHRLPGLLKLVVKVLHQLIAMLWIMLVTLPAPSNILMQNPPCIPTMVLCWIAAKRHGAKVVIDWHNFGYSIMALKRPATSFIVRAARMHEASWGRMGDKHFCVTKAMQKELSGPSWRVKATVLYDRPPKHFGRTDASTAHELLVRLAKVLAVGSGRGSSLDAAGVTSEQQHVDFAVQDAPEWGQERTILTVRSVKKGGKSWRPERPAVLISSTSWTPDEDFGVLLEALVHYEAAAQQQRQGGRKGGGERKLPDLLVLITGRWVACMALKA